ncbi:MAG: translation initiation factor IF-2 [Bacteroidales bacterium]|nr:translation initiation factor IF-2 [Bacteroidales bacterium]
MTDTKATRLSKIAREFNVGISTIVDFLHKKGQKIDTNPNTKISTEQYEMLLDEFSSDLSIKKESEKLHLRHLKEKQQVISLDDVSESDTESSNDQEELLVKDSSGTSTIFESEAVKDKEKQYKPGAVDKNDLEEKKKPEEQVSDKLKEEEADLLKEGGEKEKQKKAVTSDKEGKPEDEEEKSKVKVVGKIDLDAMNQRTRPVKSVKKEDDKEKEQKAETETGDEDLIIEDDLESGIDEDIPEEVKEEIIRARVEKLTGPTVLGKIDLPKKQEKEPAEDRFHEHKKKRKRIRKDKEKVSLEADKQNKYEGKEEAPAAEERLKKKRPKKKSLKQEISEEDVQKQIKDTLARLTKSKSKGAKYRREKRDAVSQRLEEETLRKEEAKNIIKVTEFVSVNELAAMMNVPTNEVIATCMSLGLFVSINQRLDAETMSLVAEEFGYKVEFISVEVQESIHEEVDQDEDLKSRPPIVTVMGHVDHGKTKLLDYIRHANVIEGEAGGITQHIGAYVVKLDDGRSITFLDTPGHEAFTAMRARGAQVTDVVIIVVAADDGVKPQTVEAINHAQAAGVPMVFAINKIDKPTANPEKVKEELANMNILVEDWGGKYQSQEISAKNGINIEELLEKVLLEAEILDLKANPDKNSIGTVVESSLDKGRGYTTTILVEAGTLKIGDVLLAGSHVGRVKAMYNERGKAVKEAGPATPVLILGLNGAPQAGDKFNVMDSEREAKEIANKREQLQREQGMRTQKHITLDEIGRRIAIGNFQELNIIVKGDVDGSIEALSDSLIKLSTEEIQVNIIGKAVGQISEADVYLAAASNAIIVGFQVRPSLSARKLAEKEEIDIRIYSVIYDAIEEIKSAMEGMLSPEIREEIKATLEILEVFKITKVGTVAGCMVREGKIRRDSKVRVIRDGIVIYTGELGSLKRFKDDAKEVVSGLECGLNIENFNDIKVGDFLEAFEEIEIKKTL